MTMQSFKAALARLDESAEALYNAKDARTALRAEDDFAIAFARVVATLCDNACVASDFDSAIDEGERSNIEGRILLRLAQLRTARRTISADKRNAKAESEA